MTAPLDGRRARALLDELIRRARIALPRDGQPVEPGPVARAILDSAARIGEEVTLRLDRVPAKQADNFYAALGLGRDPARPARMPIAFQLADRAPAGLTVAAGARFTATSGGAPVVFETDTEIGLVGHRIAAIVGVDAEIDAITLAAKGVVAGALPHQTPLRRVVRGGAGAGATRIQLDPMVGLAPGTTLRLGSAADAPQHDVVAIDGDLVAIDPPLAAALADGTEATEVASFAPFAAGARNRQAHALYLGHPTLLDVASAARIRVSGLALPADTQWSWWGKAEGASEADWQPLVPTAQGADLVLAKEKGAPEQVEVAGRSSLWLRAALPGASTGAIDAADVRISVAGSDRCIAAHGERCDRDSEDAPLPYEAIAVTTPIVPNQPYHPFGREPRVFDSFYIGSTEAFGKAGAEVDLCFALGGPKFGRLASVEWGETLLVFGVGADGLVYRARFGPGVARLEQLPRDGEPLPPFTAITAVQRGYDVELFIGRANGVERATFPIYLGDLPRDQVRWNAIASSTPIGMVDAIVVFPLATPRFYALAGTALFEGNLGEATPVLHPVSSPAPVQRLIRIQGSGAALVVEGKADEPQTLWRIATPDVRQQFGPKRRWPIERLACWQEGGDHDPPLILTGFTRENANAPWEISALRVTEASAVETIEIEAAAWEPAEISFDGSRVVEGVAAAMIATVTPRQLIPVASPEVEFRLFEETQPIGVGGGTGRAFVLGRERTVVPRADLGLLHRGPPVPARLGIAARLTLTPEAGFPVAETGIYATPEAESDRRNGEGYGWQPVAGGLYRQLRPLNLAQGTPPPLDALDFWAPDAPQPKAPTVQRTGDSEELHETRRASVEILPEDAVSAAATALTVLAFNPGPPAESEQSIWSLKRIVEPLAGPRIVHGWTALATFPTTDAPMPCVLLAAAKRGPAFEAVTFADPAGVEALLRAGPLTLAGTGQRLTLEAFTGTTRMARIAHALIQEGGTIDVEPGPPPWSFVGPDQPANPALSWEYWNGRSWWALEWGDTTGNLQADGGVFFTVPADLAETDVGGRKNHWIRARLVGGDYGEARVTVTTTTLPNGEQQQTVTRDLSAIRAPYILALRIGYCAAEPAKPRIVLTRDNLGTIERTEANADGLPFPVFASVRDLMQPRPAPLPAPPDAECDPCAPPPTDATAATEAPAADTLSRALLIGFEAPVAAAPLALYLDVAPVAGGGSLTAEVLRNGRFERVEILGDATMAATEPGVVAIFLGSPPDRATLFGTSAHWLRLRAAGAAWSPDLRGVHVNAVWARSVDSRRNENLGSSSGTPEQRFTLGAAPVEADSLVLCIQEDAGEEEAKALDIRQLAGRPGNWVRWREIDDLRDAQPLDRVFALDAEAGAIRFGDGIAGKIPPLGKPLVAVSYRQVTGAMANAVDAGAILAPISPLAGIDKVRALEPSAGGSDVESGAAARARAPAKTRHGGSIVTLADIETVALARFPRLVQARARRRGATIRLTAVAAGLTPLLPAELREIAATVRESASYGIAAPGRLTVTGARLLPIAITLTLIPDDIATFAALASRARAALVGFFDPATGGHDGTGWPLGARPSETDIAAALAELTDAAVLAAIGLSRRDRDGAVPLPDVLPADMLVTLVRDAVVVVPERETVA